MATKQTGLLIAFILTSTLPSMAATVLLSGQWSGTYTCAQGETAADIELTFADEKWHGVLEFGPLKINKAVPFGSYDVTVTQNGEDIVFTPGDWIEQPDDYVTVGLRGQISNDLMQITGDVEFSTCTTFALVRTTPLPAPLPRKTK